MSTTAAAVGDASRVPARPLATTIVRRRIWIVIGWLLSCALLLPAARNIQSVLSVAARVNGSESGQVETGLRRDFDSPFAHSVVLVVAGLPPPSQTAGAEALRAVVDAVSAIPGVKQVASFLDRQDDLFVGSGGKGGTFMVVGLEETPRPDGLLEPLRAATARLRPELRSRFPDLTLHWTGEVALNSDLRRASAVDAQAAEQRALPVILALLVIAFGALAAASLPIVGGLLAIGVTLGLAAFAARAWSLSILLQNVVTMIGLGLGIDYSLLIVSRFREEMNAGRAKHEAAVEALAQAGPTILLSGAAVAIGFSALALVPVNELRSVAVGGLLVVGISVLVATTLLPGLLAMLGRHIDAGRVPLGGRPTTPRWTRWAGLVTRHPGRVLLCCGVPTLLLALQARSLRIELPRGDWLPPQMESAVALGTLQTMGRSGIVHTLRVVLELPPHASALSAPGWQATERLTATIAAEPEVESVHSLPGLASAGRSGPARELILALLPDDVRRTFVSRDLRAALLEVVPREGTLPAELQALVRRIRSYNPAATTGVDATRVRVGGLPALNVDYTDAVAGRFFQVVAAIIAATFLVLAIGFRSILIPLKAIALNLLAVAGAFGAVALVFQDGIGASLLGLDRPLDGIFPAVPVLVFCIVFGLSMDYEVFLVARVREARRSGIPEKAAIADGLVHTGRLITSAAAIMIVVFGAFTFGDFLLIKILGFALAVAVLLDATVMRLAVSPALLTLAGGWNWWPGRNSEADTPSPPPDGSLHPRG